LDVHVVVNKRLKLVFLLTRRF